MVIDFLNLSATFVLFGAQVVAYGAFTAIRALTGKTPACFCVSRMEGNPSEIEGIPVRILDTVPRDTPVVVAVTELIQKNVLPLLRQRGYNYVFALTQHEEHLLMSAYYRKIGKFPLAVPGAHEADLVLYETHSHRDTPLSHPPECLSFERSIQAGATLTDVRVSPLSDSTGVNISAKNLQYCEMTATFWVWRNTSHDWSGIEHYRRHLLVTPNMLAPDVDAVLPLPYLCYPNETAQFRRFVSETTLRALHVALQSLYPHEYDAYRNILLGKYQYTYNLVCARRGVFSAYCAWVFQIMEYMESLTNIAPELANTRAFSYVAEVLTNIYFMFHQKELKILHAEKAVFV